jgi:hypothetical protein
MPYLNLTAGEPWAATWGVMHFPDDEQKRRGYIARLWAGFYPKYEKAGVGERLPRSVLLSVMKETAATPIETAEVQERHHQALLAGEQFKVLMAIANSDPNRASWNMAARLVERQTKSRASLYKARRRFMPVIHLWAAFILRECQWHNDAARHFTALDDLNVFITEAMALLQWGTLGCLGTRRNRSWIAKRSISGRRPRPGPHRRSILTGRGMAGSPPSISRTNGLPGLERQR